MIMCNCVRGILDAFRYFISSIYSSINVQSDAIIFFFNFWGIVNFEIFCLRIQRDFEESCGCGEIKGILFLRFVMVKIFNTISK